MSRIKLALAAALVLVLFLLGRAPASLISGFLPAGQVSLQGVEGTLWRGSAASAALRLGAGQLRLGALQWRLSPWSVLLASPRVALESRWGNQHLEALVTYGGAGDLAVSDLDASMPASLVREFLPLELTGNVSVLARRLVLRDGLPVAADGRLVWQYAGWVSPQGLRSLGRYALDIRQADGEELVGLVSTLDGDLRAEGRVALAQRDYDVDVLLSGPGLDDPPLQQALQLVAAPEGGGYRVQLQGAL